VSLCRTLHRTASANALPALSRGIESIVEANPKEQELPTGRIAFCLIVGFTLMLIIEQLISPNAHAHSMDNGSTFSKLPGSTSEVEFDAELGDLDPTGRAPDRPANTPTATTFDGETGSGRERAFTLLLGLLFHGCADGLALGVANLAKTAPGATNAVSFVVFLALILHKGVFFPVVPIPDIDAQRPP